MQTLLRLSSSKPGLVIVMLVAGAAVGGAWLRDLRRDVFPDLSTPIFNVIVQNAAMGAEELETSVAIPMEASLAGLPLPYGAKLILQSLGTCALAKARQFFRIFAGFCLPTSRKVSFACACDGSTVFVPAPV